MLLDRSREIARTLQDSLLPASLPDVEGLDVAARYVAGTLDPYSAEEYETRIQEDRLARQEVDLWTAVKSAVQQ